MRTKISAATLHLFSQHPFSCTAQFYCICDNGHDTYVYITVFYNTFHLKEYPGVWAPTVTDAFVENEERKKFMIGRRFKIVTRISGFTVYSSEYIH